jgi:response regulator RpfG family c-di-GMP phosphodiesterase
MQRIRRPRRVKKEFSILYVDDEMPNLRGFKSSFKRTFNVFVAINGHEAIKIINSQDINLIVSDHRMPEMNGTELLREVHDIDPEIKRMILSGFIKRDELKGAVESYGIHDFVTKPWDFENLMGIFNNLLKNKETGVMSFGRIT